MSPWREMRSFSLLAGGMFVFGLLVAYVAWQEGDHGFALAAPLWMGGSVLLVGLLTVWLRKLFGTSEKRKVLEPAKVRHAPVGLLQTVRLTILASLFLGCAATGLTLLGLAILEPFVTLPWHARDTRDLFVELTPVFIALIAVAFAVAFYLEHRGQRK